MPAEVRIPSLLQKLVGGAKTVDAEGQTVGHILDDLEAKYPGFKERVLDEEGKLRLFVNIFINNEDIRFLKELETPVADGDIITILPAVAGGK